MNLTHIEVALKNAQKALMTGDLQISKKEVDFVIQQDSKSVEAYYILAVIHRYEKDFESAQQAIKKILDLAPDFGRGFQELGHLWLAQGNQKAALNAFEQATRLNPALLAAWTAKAKLLSSFGKTSEARQAQAQLQRLQNLPKQLLAATNYLSENKIGKAEQYCRTFLRENPKNVDGMRLLAEIASRYGVLDEAEFLLASALEFEPDNIQVRIDLIQILRKRQKFEESVYQARHLYNTAPDNPVFMSHLAIQSMQAGAYESALSLFDQILEKLPDDPVTLTSRGHALKTLGKQEEAISSYRSALKSDPALGDAWYGLANLKTFRFEPDEITAMEKQHAIGLTSANARTQIHFSLGKAYEDQKEYEKSFAHYEAGNRLKKSQSRYTSEQLADEFKAQKAFCTKELFQILQDKGCDAPDPIFIVGLPRAGSTLLEQILASHSQVDGTMELPNILTMAHSLRQRRPIHSPDGYPGGLAKLDTKLLRKLGETYIQETMQHRAGAPYFIDKMPNNFRHVGLIKLILPNAKIIDARRNPMDCCFSGFKQLFAEGQEFTYGLTEIGRYYRGYVDLMDHWDQVLPGEILRVQYEDVVADTETQVRRILNYCSLPFEDACLDFHKTERAVKTASSEQVREKINTKGMDRWKPFEPWLDPLREALGDLI